MDRRSGGLIAIEGIDGSGKSAVAPVLVRELCRRGVSAELVGREIASGTLDGEAGARLRTLGSMLWGSSRGVSVLRLGDAHLVHLLASWMHLYSGHVLSPALASGRTLVVDWWYYKYVARFGLKPGGRWTKVEDLFHGVAVPSAVVLLTIESKIAAVRKGAFRDTEVEANATIAGTAAAFIRHQTAVQEVLRGMAGRRGWLMIDASRDIDSVALDIAQRILSNGESRCGD